MAADCSGLKGLMTCHWESQALCIRYLRGTPAAVGSLLAWASPWIFRAREQLQGYVFMCTLSHRATE